MVGFDCIDSSVILGTLFEKEEKCEQYVNIVGYKLRNKGLLTIPLIGEIFTNTFLKVSKNIEEVSERKFFIQNAVDFFDTTIMGLLQRDKLVIAKIEIGDHLFTGRIKEIDYRITDDDALHLSSAINKKCQRFVTIDKELLKENFKNKIKEEFGIIITEP